MRGPGGGLIYEHSPSGDFYYYFDGLGSVIGLVDAANGNQRAAYTYDPYGANATATGVNGALPANPWRWAGGYLDATTGLYHFGARYYDPVTGRFTQRDPLGGGYGYGSGNPGNRVDPTGLADFQPIPLYEELCGFGAGYYPNLIGTTTCVNYRNARVTGIADYYYYGAPRPVRHDFDKALQSITNVDYYHVYQYLDACVSFAESGAEAGGTYGAEGAILGGMIGCSVSLGAQGLSDALRKP